MAFSDGSDKVFTASIDNEIRCWDLRKNEVAYTLTGHSDTVTVRRRSRQRIVASPPVLRCSSADPRSLDLQGLALSPDGKHLLSNAMDNTLRSWDVQPFAPEDRCVAVRERDAAASVVT